MFFFFLHIILITYVLKKWDRWDRCGIDVGIDEKKTKFNESPQEWYTYIIYSFI